MTTFATMEKATQFELRLAERMSRLGTETAFEVLNKARALEAGGLRSCHHLKIGEPDFCTPPTTSSRPLSAHSETWMDPLWPFRRTAGTPRNHGKLCGAAAVASRSLPIK